MKDSQYLENSNVQAFLRAIRLGEGTSDSLGYSRLCGGGEAITLTNHPAYHGHRVWLPRYKVWSTAAGAYQINKPTWEMLGHDELSPFGRPEQDYAALQLIKRKKALEDILEGRITSAVLKCSPVWASLPYSHYGQRTVQMRQFLAEYRKHGGLVFEADDGEEKSYV